MYEKRGISKAILIAVIVVAILVVGGAGAALVKSPTTTTSESLVTTNYTSSLQNTAAGITSTSSATTTQSTTTASINPASGTSNGLVISINQVLTDSVEYQSSGYTYWILTVTFTDTGTSMHYVNPVNFQLTSNANAVYEWTVAAADQNDLQAVTLNPGQHTSGQVAFKLPNGEAPSMLEYSYSLESVDVKVENIPAPSGTVSYIQFGPATVTGTSQNYVNAELSVVNSTNYFYTGQTIELKVALTNFDVTNHTISSISISGFTVITTAPSLPVTVGNSEVNVLLLVTCPSASFNGTPAVTVTVSS